MYFLWNPTSYPIAGLILLFSIHRNLDEIFLYVIECPLELAFIFTWYLRRSIGISSLLHMLFIISAILSVSKSSEVAHFLLQSHRAVILWFCSSYSLQISLQALIFLVFLYFCAVLTNTKHIFSTDWLSSGITNIYWCSNKSDV